MKITVVSVAYNEEKNISKTIESVLGQTSNAIEYIICDGGSTDKTIEIAESYKVQFGQRGIEYIINSEKDSGIYDGMNKGIKKATGDYIFFLNAGDWFYSDDVIESVVDIAKNNQMPDFIYGNLMFLERGVVYPVYGDANPSENAVSIPHQALFSSTKIMKNNLFDLKYKIAADYKFTLSQKLQKKTFCKLDKMITYFSGDGVSNQNLILLVKEQNEIRRSLGVFENPQKNIDVYKAQISIFIKSFMPQKIWELWSVKVKRKTLYKEDSL